MAACCLIGTKPGEVKAFWYNTDKDEWKNFAADQRNSQVQVVKEANILYLRVIPDDKSPEYKFPIHNGITANNPGRACIQLVVQDNIYQLKFGSVESAEQFETNLTALKELKPLPPPVVNPSRDHGRPQNLELERGPPQFTHDQGERKFPPGSMPGGVPQPEVPVNRWPQPQPEQRRAKVPTAEKQPLPNATGMKQVLLLDNPEAIARQLALALNQNNTDKALQCIDSIAALKKNIKFQITYTIEEKPAKGPIDVTVNIEFQSQKKSLKVFINADENYTFSKMQQTIEETYRIPSATQKWIVGENIISNDSLEKKLIDYGITNALEDVTLYVYVLNPNKPNPPRGGSVTMEYMQPLPGVQQSLGGFANQSALDGYQGNRGVNVGPVSRQPSDSLDRGMMPSQPQFGRPYQERGGDMSYGGDMGYGGRYQQFDGRGPEQFNARFEGSYRREAWGPGPGLGPEEQEAGIVGSYQQQRDAWAQRPGPEGFAQRMPREY